MSGLNFSNVTAAPSDEFLARMDTTTVPSISGYGAPAPSGVDPVWGLVILAAGIGAG